MGTQTRPDRIAGLDGLRGLAAASVMGFHYTGWNSSRDTLPDVHTPYLFWFPYGIYGVDLFFIISGFVIFMTLERTSSLYQFAVARFARLYPAFLASMIVTIGIACALHYPVPLSIPNVLADMTLVPAPLGHEYIDTAYWTLSYEVEFYLFAAIGFFVLRWREPEIPCAVWLVLNLYLRCTPFATLFVIGIMLYRIHSRCAGRLTVTVLALGLTVTFAGPQRLPGYGPFITLFTVAVYFATTRAGAVLRIPPLRRLGRISYPLYLLHQVAGVAIIRQFELLGVGPNRATVLGMTAILCIAWAISTTIEWPANRWLRRKLVGRPDVVANVAHQRV